MVEGEKRWCGMPGKLAFGEAKPGEPPAEGVAPRGMLVYDVELVRFDSPPRNPATTPPDE